MSAKIFISYRRDDSAGHAGRVTDRLEREFGRDLLFMDVDAIPLGRNFVTVLHEEVAKCGALLAVIGSDWLDVRDDDGNRRLDNPNDFVRIEIAAALQRDIPVIPILLDGAKIPRANQLPDDLKELASRNGLDVRHASFHNDMEKLIRGLKGAINLPSIEAEVQAKLASELAERGRATLDYPPLIHTVTNEQIAKFDPKVAEVMKVAKARPASYQKPAWLSPAWTRLSLLLGAGAVAAAIALFWFYFSPGADVKSNAPQIQYDRPSDKAPAPLNLPPPPNTKVIR
jgi:hypothetical protein